MLPSNLGPAGPEVQPAPAPSRPTHPLLAGLRAFRSGRPCRSLSDHLRLADGPAADHEAYLTECQLRAAEWDQRRAESIAAIDADLVWQQTQGAI